MKLSATGQELGGDVLFVRLGFSGTPADYSVRVGRRNLSWHRRESTGNFK